MKETIRIPYPPTKAGRKAWAKEYGLNAYYAGKHWSRRKTDAEYWHTLVHSEMRRQGVRRRPFEKPVVVTFYWNDRLDIDNHAIMRKMIVDAMKGVLLQDDDRHHLRGVTHLWHDEDYILVEIEEVATHGEEKRGR